MAEPKPAAVRRPRGRPRRETLRECERLTVRLEPELRARVEVQVRRRQESEPKYSLNDWCVEAMTAAVEAEEEG